MRVTCAGNVSNLFLAICAAEASIARKMLNYA